MFSVLGNQYKTIICKTKEGGVWGKSKDNVIIFLLVFTLSLGCCRFKVGKISPFHSQEMKDQCKPFISRLLCFLIFLVYFLSLL